MGEYVFVTINTESLSFKSRFKWLGFVMKTVIAIASVIGIAMTSSAMAGNLVTNGDFSQTTVSGLPSGVDSFEFGDTYKYGQVVTGWTSTTAKGASHGAFNVYFQPDHAFSNNNPVNPDTRYTSAETQYLWTDAATADPNGGAFVALDGDYLARGVLSQTISGLSVGGKYDLTFDWAAAQFHDRSGDTTEQLQVTFGNQTVSTAVVKNPSHGAQGWFTEHFEFTATSASQTLSFLSIGTPSGLPPVALLDGVSLTSATPEPQTWALMMLAVGGIGGVLRNRRRAVAAG